MGCGSSSERVPPKETLEGEAWALKEAMRVEGTPLSSKNPQAGLHPKVEEVLVEMAGRLRHEELLRVVEIFDTEHSAGKATVSDFASERLEGVRGKMVRGVLRPRAGPIAEYLFSRLGGKWVYGAFVEAFCHLVPDEVVRGDVQRMWKVHYGGAKGTTLRQEVEKEADEWPMREALLRQGCCTPAESRAEWVADVVEGRPHALTERGLVRMLVTMDGHEVREMRTCYEARHQAGDGLLADLEHELCGDFTEALRALAGRGDPLPGIDLTAGQCNEIIDGLLAEGKIQASTVPEGHHDLVGVEEALVKRLGMLSCDHLAQLKRHYYQGKGQGKQSLHAAVMEAHGPERFEGPGAKDTLTLLSALLMPRKQALAVFCHLCLVSPEGGSLEAGAWELACLLQHKTHAERAEIRWHYTNLFHRMLGDDIVDVYHSSMPDVCLFLCSLCDDVAQSVAVTLEKAAALRKVDAFCVYLSTYYDLLMDEVREAFVNRFNGDPLTTRLEDLCDGNLRDVKVLQTFVNFASRSAHHGVAFVQPAGTYPHMDVGGMEEWHFTPANQAPSFFKSHTPGQPSRGPPPGPDAQDKPPQPIYWTDKAKPHVVYYSRDKAAFKRKEFRAFPSEWHLLRHKVHLGHDVQIPHVVK